MVSWTLLLRASQILQCVAQFPIDQSVNSGESSCGGEVLLPLMNSQVWSRTILMFLDHQIQFSQPSSLVIVRAGFSMAVSDMGVLVIEALDMLFFQC